MVPLDQLRRDVVFVRSARRVLKRLEPVSPDMTETAADIIEQQAKIRPQSPAVFFEDRAYSYAEYNAWGNRYAHWARSLGLTQGDVVALYMQNRPEFLFAWLGMAKIGVVSALINTHQQGRALAHSIETAGARLMILGAEQAPQLATASGHLERPLKVWSTGGLVPGAEDLDAALAAQPETEMGPAERPGLRGRDPVFYIYTSGTTGLPKAARFAHSRLQAGFRYFSAAVNARPEDRMYITLPLYHSAGGVAATGTVFFVGGAVVLRRKFSATAFWDDVHNYEATLFQYIGELCRYLLNTEPHAKERDHKLRCAVGNGLRPEIWERFQDRFRIPKILEFYLATEGNVSLFNFDGKPGAIGRVPRYLQKQSSARLVKFDHDTQMPARGPDGLCIPCAAGEVGEAVGQIVKASKDPKHQFDGYTDKKATEKKIIHDVLEKGDSYFRTGDLMRQDAQGYFYFVDRIGDTFRWKGENVATSEVAEIVNVFPGVKEANIYGVTVPGAEGRAGMVSLVTDGDLDFEAFKTYLEKELPSYARPLFLRLLPKMDVTGTLKHRKVDLVRDGFDPHEIEDPLYVLDPDAKAYVPLTEARYARIQQGALA